MKSYEVLPLLDTPERAQVISSLLRKIASFETVFSDFQRGCEEGCSDLPLPQMCPQCLLQMRNVASSLASPHAKVWEVWAEDVEAEAPEPELVGVVYLEDIRRGEDATAHYVFFDHDLKSKTGLLKELILWVFHDHEDEGWKALHRITVEIPAYAHALSRHAESKLGFTPEGVKREAVTWKGRKWDLQLLGLLRRDLVA